MNLSQIPAQVIIDLAIKYPYQGESDTNNFLEELQDYAKLNTMGVKQKW